MSKKVVYIAGPFRARSAWRIEQNVRVAEDMALNVWKMGGVAVCPHTLTRFYQGELPDEEWLEGDLELLSRCDAIWLAPRWKESPGAMKEEATARRIELKRFYPDDLLDLREYVSGYSTDPPVSC